MWITWGIMIVIIIIIIDFNVTYNEYWMDWNWERHTFNNLMMGEFSERAKLERVGKNEGKNREIGY